MATFHTFKAMRAYWRSKPQRKLSEPTPKQLIVKALEVFSAPRTQYMRDRHDYPNSRLRNRRLAG